MNNRTRVIASAALLLAGAITTVTLTAQQTPGLVVIPPPGTASQFNFGNVADPMASNDAGQFAAYADGDVVIWDPVTGYENIGHSGDGTHPLAMNNVGQVAGYNYVTDGNQPVIWDRVHGWQVVPGLGNISSIIAINDHGQAIFPNTQLDDGTVGSGMWDPQNGIMLAPMGAIAVGINNAGQVLLRGNYRGYVWDTTHPDVAPVDIGDLGSPTVWANAITANGSVVGWAMNPSDQAPDEGAAPQEAFLWDPVHGMRALGVLATLPDRGEGAPRMKVSSALAANGDTVVGYSGRSDGRFSAFVWTEAGGMRDIGLTVPRDAYFSSARAITSSGFILGSGTGTDGLNFVFGGSAPPAPTLTWTVPGFVGTESLSGAAVNFTVAAADGTGVALTPSCFADGSAFVSGGTLSLGTHTITCTATDSFNQTVSRTASVVVLLHGLAGAQGLTGPTGATGATGATGTAGAIGSKGPIGPQGPAGAQGAAGPIGPMGPTGPDGPRGTAGATGATGVRGVTGATGPVGPPGATGPQGPSAANGFAVTLRDVSSNTAITMPSDNTSVVYLVTTPRSNLTMTMPAAASAASRTVTITRVDTGRKVFVNPPSGTTFAGGETPLVLDSRYDSVTFVSDGHQWLVLILR